MPIISRILYVVVSVNLLLNSIQCMYTSDKDKLKLQLRIAQCRATCLDQFSLNTKPVLTCHETPECNMCWETCELLHKNFDVWGPMCNVSDICFPGCKTSCFFYLQGNNSNFIPHAEKRWIFPKPIEFIYLPKMNCMKLYWAAPVSWKPSDPGHIVYVVMVKDKMTKSNSSWKQIFQTYRRTLCIKVGWMSRATEVEVIAITARGILAEKLEPYVTDHKETAVQDEAKTVSESNYSVAMTENEDFIWRPTLLSMEFSRNIFGVEATVTWPALRSTGAAKYEVTWKVLDESMEITGHLYTPNNIVKLSLWPEALYSIQVKCYADFNKGVPVSEDLTVNTRAIVTSASLFLKEYSDCLKVEIIAGCAVGVFLVLALSVIVWLCKKALQSQIRLRNIQRIPTIRIKSSREPSSKELHTKTMVTWYLLAQVL
ncbi:uncharacterized protein LOC143252386 isoform X2 [Tachypleus tridentatus]|uniref:uncharacterized protein LOC143252386 isoform X2 n=1 Tax=Tachypleus tridentatus TaxID=6853 RepID=UPI003FD27156